MLQKNKIITILSVLLVLFTFTSCNDDDEVVQEKKKTARYDTGFKICLRDTDGNNLLDPKVEGYFNIDNIRVFTSDAYNSIIEVRDYTKRKEDAQKRDYSRVNDIIGGIQNTPMTIAYICQDKEGEYLLYVTFLDQTVPVGEKKMDVVTIRWGDGTSDTFSYIVKANSEKDLTFSYYINGEYNYGNTFFITKR